MLFFFSDTFEAVYFFSFQTSKNLLRNNIPICSEGVPFVEGKIRRMENTEINQKITRLEAFAGTASSG